MERHDMAQWIIYCNAHGIDPTTGEPLSQTTQKIGALPPDQFATGPMPIVEADEDTIILPAITREDIAKVQTHHLPAKK